MIKNNCPLGMFDSGVGGLTVYKEIKKVLPKEKIIYIGDTKRFPYGSKTKKLVTIYSKECINFLIKKGVKKVIIACGTATSYAYDEIKDNYNIPVEGIIEPTINYIKENKYKKVGIIATRGSINSKAWEKKLKKSVPNINIIARACPLLAPMAEEGWTNNNIAKLVLKKYLTGMDNIDALVLGCTHYPLFEKLIKEILPKVKIINPGKILANRLKKEVNSKGSNKEDEFYLTDNQCNFINVAEKLLKKKINIKKEDI